MRSLRFFWPVGLAVLVTTSPLFGLSGQGQFRTSTDIVEVHATVKLKNGTIAHDLTRDDFELFEDGKRREIAVFSRSVQPLSIVLLLDHSGSTDLEFANVRSAAQEFVGRLLREDRTAIATLTWDCHGFTNDPRALLSVLRMDLPRDRGSPIWSATDRAMESLAPEGGRRVVLLFSDGDDNQRPALPGGSATVPPSASMMNPCAYVPPGEMRFAFDVAKRAEREAIMVYTVSVPVSSGSGGAGVLSSLSKQTGASYQQLRAYSELRAAFTSIADELHLQYLLGFVPTAFDGKRHRIEVRSTRPGVTVQARQAYVAAKTGK